jgi:hypothetical protein
VPSRRTFAKGVVPFAHSEKTFVSHSSLHSVFYAVSMAQMPPSSPFVFPIGSGLACCDLRGSTYSCE